MMQGLKISYRLIRITNTGILVTSVVKIAYNVWQLTEVGEFGTQNISINDELN